MNEAKQRVKFHASKIQFNLWAPSEGFLFLVSLPFKKKEK